VKKNISLQDLILSMTTTDAWEDAKIFDALLYVRKSCLLKIPEEFRDMMLKI